MFHTRGLVTLALGSTLVLAGCDDGTDVTLHEPGEYKGQRDPLLNRNVPQREEALAARFAQVQVDR